MVSGFYAGLTQHPSWSSTPLFGMVPSSELLAVLEKKGYKGTTAVNSSGKR